MFMNTLIPAIIGDEVDDVLLLDSVSRQKYKLFSSSVLRITNYEDESEFSSMGGH